MLIGYDVKCIGVNMEKWYTLDGILWVIPPLSRACTYKLVELY